MLQLLRELEFDDNNMVFIQVKAFRKFTLRTCNDMKKIIVYLANIGCHRKKAGGNVTTHAQHRIM